MLPCIFKFDGFLSSMYAEIKTFLHRIFFNFNKKNLEISKIWKNIKNLENIKNMKKFENLIILKNMKILKQKFNENFKKC